MPIKHLINTTHLNKTINKKKHSHQYTPPLKKNLPYKRNIHKKCRNQFALHARLNLLRQRHRAAELQCNMTPLTLSLLRQRNRL